MVAFRSLSASAALLAALGSACGCAATGSAPAAAPAVARAGEPDAGEPPLPQMLQDLRLTPAQRSELRRLAVDVRREARPLVDAGRQFGRTLAGAARRCKSESRFLEMEASFMVSAGEQIRGPMLDAIQRLHRILTPAQRRELSRRLIDLNQAPARERRGEARTRELGEDLDLSFGQTLTLLMRAQMLRSRFDERFAPWRVRYHDALADFPRDDFLIREKAIAKVPIVELAADFVLEATRVLLPLLDARQCETLGAWIETRLEERPSPN
jgi:Spy/CpxP family protein refolding chaperone